MSEVRESAVITDRILREALAAYRDAGKVRDEADHEFAMRMALVAAFDTVAGALEQA